MTENSGKHEAGRFTAGLVQMTAEREHAPNIEAASAMIREAAERGAEFVLTPENTTMMEPKRRKLLEKAYAEEDHPGVPAFRALAEELGIWLLIGSLTVKVGEERAANRSLLFAPDGRIAARYDKIHMFDVDIPDGQTYRESKTFRPGDKAVSADLPWGRLGMTVCYDVRFPYLYRDLAKAGAHFLSVPAAFTKFTGQAHWHVLLRARAVETGCFVLAPAQCGTHAEDRQTYGHSLAVAPWGEVLAEGGETPGVILVEIEPGKVQEARNMVPSLSGDRPFASAGRDAEGQAAQ
ncbi:MAG: carbon-nitrogen hydrolase family protein [Rhodovibrionaceae bacterium]|nr:carbon-nitrogen hydrolase family protein [Rhodovibrionaceae bacterium]